MAAIHGRFTRSQILIQNGMGSDLVLSSSKGLRILPPHLPLKIGVCNSTFSQSEASKKKHGECLVQSSL